MGKLVSVQKAYLPVERRPEDGERSQQQDVLLSVGFAAVHYLLEETGPFVAG